ncbi:homoserine kinase [Actinophytocola xanthii]|uniref:Homoserine kinase n=1 Tax=Actinophytocola xanthii TaxID=1912961 RepID=A0A1Q8CWF5_9PSEU|nr:homoserine kinase [Actinophytocola xanthii]OLF18695.1 homoserine kinase [Actinophytocola xanthii]
MTAVRVTVPASSANLGPGFDALGMALALYDVVEVRLGGRDVRGTVAGEGADLVVDEKHLVARALASTAAHLGCDLPGLELTCVNQIPHARGLGSSAAAVVAGVAAGYALAGRALDETALQLAAEFEGHADNAAASLLGGLVLAWSEQDGPSGPTPGSPRYHAVRLDPHEALRPVVFVPNERSATALTRGLLPVEVPHADAAFAAGRCALAVHALTVRPDLLLPATADRLHQDYRAQAWPNTMRLVRELRENAVAATVSGAGPAVVAMTLDGRVPAGVDTAGFTVRELAVDRNGVRVEPLEQIRGR